MSFGAVRPVGFGRLGMSNYSLFMVSPDVELVLEAAQQCHCFAHFPSPFCPHMLASNPIPLIFVRAQSNLNEWVVSFRETK